MIQRRQVLAGLATAAAAPLLGAGAGLAFTEISGVGQTLAARAFTRTLKAGAAPAALLGFGGALPGPILTVKAGSKLRLRLDNGLDEALSLHWHGLRGGDAGLDGVEGLGPSAGAAGRTVRDIVLPVPEAGLVIYRPLVIGRSAELTERGLAGLLVAEEAEPPPVDRDMVCAIDDIRLDASGAISPFGDAQEGAGAGRLGNMLLVNGTAAPLVEKVPPGARVRLRLANLCNARLMRIRFDGMKAWVVAIDGQPTDTFEPLRASLPFAPGSRYEIIAQMPSHGQSAAVVATIGDGLALVTFKAHEDAGRAQAGLPPVAAPAPNAALPAEIKLQRAVRADLAITGGIDTQGGGPARPFAINGGKGSLTGKPLVSVKRGTPVVLALANKTAWPQPLHLHGHVCRLLHPFDDGWEPYWLDTVTVPPQQVLHVAFIADNPGRWLVGSTVLERLDAGLFSWFEVI